MRTKAARKCFLQNAEKFISDAGTPHTYPIKESALHNYCTHQGRLKKESRVRSFPSGPTLVKGSPTTTLPSGETITTNARTDGLSIHVM